MKYSFCLLFSMAVLLQLAGQSDKNSEAVGDVDVKENPALLRVHFSVFVSAEQGILTEHSAIIGVPQVFYDSPTGVRELPLKKQEATGLFPYEGPQSLVLYQAERIRVPPPEGSPVGTPPSLDYRKIPLAKVNLSKDLDRVIIILFPGQKNADGTIQSVAIPYDSNTLRPGMARIINGTDRLLALKFEEEGVKVFKLGPNSNFDFSPSDIGDSNYPRVYIFGLIADQLRKLHTNRLYLKPGATNVFLVYPQGSRRVRIMPLGSHEPLNSLPITP